MLLLSSIGGNRITRNDPRPDSDIHQESNKWTQDCLIHKQSCQLKMSGRLRETGGYVTFATLSQTLIRKSVSLD